MTDLLYFGYEHEADSHPLEIEFINDIKTKFPDVILEDAYDDIKGYRHNVSLDSSEKEEYLMYIIAEGWAGCSMMVSLFSMSKDRADEFSDIIAKAKVKYPHKFK